MVLSPSTIGLTSATGATARTTPRRAVRTTRATRSADGSEEDIPSLGLPITQGHGSPAILGGASMPLLLPALRATHQHFSTHDASFAEEVVGIPVAKNNAGDKKR